MEDITIDNNGRMSVIRIIGCISEENGHSNKKGYFNHGKDFPKEILNISKYILSGNEMIMTERYLPSTISLTIYNL